MGTQKNCRGGKIQKFVLYIAPILAAVLHYFLEKETLQTLFSNGVFMILLSSAFLLFMRTGGGKLFHKIEHEALFWGCFAASCLILGMHSLESAGVLWLLAVAFTAMEAGLELSVVVHIFLMVEYVIMVLIGGGDLYAFAAALLFGFILAALFSLYRSKEATLYLAVILLAVDGVLKFILYRLNIDILLANIRKIAIEMAGIIILVIFGRLFLKYAPERTEEEMQRQSGTSAKSSWEEYLLQITAPDYPLAQRMQEYSKDLYRHSKRIADLSEQAVKTIGGDAWLARAGGFYHEIGRITGEDNYIQAGLDLGRQYDFPEQLQSIIRQHSPNYELPESPEAAVVMLSDCIISTGEYLSKSGMRGKLADEKLVHSVFQNRLAKGNLKDSGMSVEQLEDLQAYFIEHAFEKGDVE